MKGQSHIIELSGVEVFVLQVLADMTSGAKHAVRLLVDLTQVVITFCLGYQVTDGQRERETHREQEMTSQLFLKQC